MTLPQVTAARAALYALLGLLVLALIAAAAWWLLIRPRQAQVAAKTAKVEAVISQATAGAAQDAVKIVTVHDREVERIHTITQGGVHAIQIAPDARTSIPAVAAAMRGSLCLFDAYRADPGCAALPSAGEGVGVAGSNAGGATPGR